MPAKPSGAEGSQRPLKKVRLSMDEAKDLFGETVAIVVGPREEVFHVHETLLRASCPFFDRAMGPMWKESQKRKVTLPDDDPDIVKLYIYWLYCGALLMYPQESQESAEREDINYVKAWILGDKLLDLEFQNTVIEGFFDRYHAEPRDGKRWNVSSGVVDYAFDKTYKGAPIRRLFVDMYCVWSKMDILACWEREGNIPHDFLVEAVRTLAKRPFSCASLISTDYYMYD
ncbi:hypothetical protein F1880_000818 [Penicillium rolfsii]|nr:hypothetical protein F1880_000818 [Penicillium rolfsii]